MKTIELTPKQAEYIREARHRWNFASGAVRSGKSHLAIIYTIPKCLRERHGLKGINLILGASKENIERNVLTPMRDFWGNAAVSDINSRNWAIIFGEKVYCIGAENVRQVSKLRGSEIKFCYCDEIVDINKDVFEMLKSRLSLSYSVCHAACNPSYPTHFIKTFIDSAEKGVDIYHQHYTIYDNPFLPESYIKSLEAEYANTVYFDRYIRGIWTKAEGLVYPMYQHALEKVDGQPSTNVTNYVLSIDYGTLNPFAALCWEKRGNTWYASKGYYYSGRSTGKQKTDEDYAKDMDVFVDEVLKRCPNWRSGRIQTIIDPSAASFITLMKRREWCRIRHANNDVLDGIRETALAIQKGLIKIDPGIEEWQQEAEGYVWDDNVEDRPVKEADHYMDATRYFVKTMRVAQPKSDYQPIWN